MKPVASKNAVTCGRFGRDPPAARPGMEILKLSAKTGEGMASIWIFSKAGAYFLAPLLRSEK